MLDLTHIYLENSRKSIGMKNYVNNPTLKRDGAKAGHQVIFSSLERAAISMPEYEPTVGKFLDFLNTIEGKQPGNPIKAANAIIQMVGTENPPLRFVLGKYAYTKFRKKINTLTQELDAWEAIGVNTDFETA
jgi:hypothetical protein